MLKKTVVSLLLILGVIMTVNNTFAQTKTEIATFAGGCFWCMEAPFEKLDGVLDVISGYTGGEKENPTYEDYGKKGHIEAIEIKYNPEKNKL